MDSYHEQPDHYLPYLDAVNQISKQHGIPVDGLGSDTFGRNPSAVYQALKNGDTDGIYLCGTKRSQQILKRFLKLNFDKLVIFSALYNKALVDPDTTDKYFAGNIDCVYEDIPEFCGIIRLTHGLLLYREQFIEIVQKISGYTPDEADQLRKIMAKKNISLVMKQKKIFIQNAASKEIESKTADELYDLLFKQCQSLSSKKWCRQQAELIFKTAYLKCYYSEIWMNCLQKLKRNGSDS